MEAHFSWLHQIHSVKQAVSSAQLWYISGLACRVTKLLEVSPVNNVIW